MKIQKMKVANLKPLEENVRKHGEIQIRELVRSLEHFGQTRAIVVDEKNNILIGNGLHAAMERCGIDEAFVYRKSGMSEIEKKKLILADNKTYSLGMDDYDNIEKYLQDITSSGDFDVAGFDEDVLKNLMRDAEEVLESANGFGKISDDEIQSFKSKGENVERKIEQSAGSVQSQGEEYHEEEKQFDQIGRGEESNGEVITIICPSCGEVIPLD